MPPPLPESPHALRSFVAVRPPPPGRHSPCENLAHFFVFAPLHRHSLLHNLATCRFFSLPVSPPPVAQFQHMSFSAPLNRRPLQHNFSTCRFFSRPLVATAFCAICVATSIAQFQHIDLILPLAHFQHVSFLFAPRVSASFPRSPQPLRKFSTFLGFRAPGSPPPSAQFGHVSFFFASCVAATGCAISTHVFFRPPESPPPSAQFALIYPRVFFGTRQSTHTFPLEVFNLLEVFV